MKVLTLWKRRSLARRRKRIDLAWAKRRWKPETGTITCSCGWSSPVALPIDVNEYASVVRANRGAGGYVNVRDAAGRRIFHRCPPL